MGDSSDDLLLQMMSQAVPVAKMASMHENDPDMIKELRSTIMTAMNGKNLVPKEWRFMDKTQMSGDFYVKFFMGDSEKNEETANATKIAPVTGLTLNQGQHVLHKTRGITLELPGMTAPVACVIVKDGICRPASMRNNEVAKTDCAWIALMLDFVATHCVEEALTDEVILALIRALSGWQILMNAIPRSAAPKPKAPRKRKAPGTSTGAKGGKGKAKTAARGKAKRTDDAMSEDEDDPQPKKPKKETQSKGKTASTKKKPSARDYLSVEAAEARDEEEEDDEEDEYDLNDSFINDDGTPTGSDSETDLDRAEAKLREESKKRRKKAKASPKRNVTLSPKKANGKRGKQAKAVDPLSSSGDELPDEPPARPLSEKIKKHASKNDGEDSS